MKPEERALVLAQIDDDSHKLSYEMLGNLLFGFNHRLVPIEIRRPYHIEFFEKLPNWLKTKSHEVSKTIINDLMPEIEDDEWHLKQLQYTIEQTDNRYFIKKLQAQIDDRKIARKVIALGDKYFDAKV